MSKQISIRRVDDEAEVDETAARATLSTDRVMSLRMSLFRMMFSFVTLAFGVEGHGGLGNDTSGTEGCQRRTEKGGAPPLPPPF
jgi:hypothetical protein